MTLCYDCHKQSDRTTKLHRGDVCPDCLAISMGETTALSALPYGVWHGGGLIVNGAGANYVPGRGEHYDPRNS